MRATAAVLRDPEADYSIEEIDLPPPGPGELLVHIVGTGHCHTDTLFRNVPGAPLPLVLGHEGAGIVEEVGPGVSGFSVGDHVVLSFDSCGTCRNCLIAKPAYCEQFALRNFSGRRVDERAVAVDKSGALVGNRWFGQSSFSDWAIATARNTVVVPRDVDLELLGPLGCGVQTGAGSVLNALDVTPGSSLAVFGVGAVGMAAVMAAVIAGASRIIAIDRHQWRLDLALSLGATDVIDAGTTEDLGMELQARTAGGSDYALDTTGSPDVVRSAIAGLRLTGVCGLVGAGMRELSLQSSGLFGKTILGIYEGNSVPQLFIPKLIDFWRDGRFPFDRLLERIPLTNIDEAERRALAGELIKPVLIPQELD
jgi:aryl-alcohol dehydrogenase